MKEYESGNDQLHFINDFSVKFNDSFCELIFRTPSDILHKSVLGPYVFSTFIRGIDFDDCETALFNTQMTVL